MRSGIFKHFTRWVHSAYYCMYIYGFPSCLHDTTILIILNSRRLNYDSTVTKTLRFVISASQTRF